MLETLITKVSRDLFVTVKSHLGKTAFMQDNDWRYVIDRCNEIVKECEGSEVYEYAKEYALVLLDELDREARRDRQAGVA